MSSRQEQKAAARAAREQAQQQATDAQRRRRLLQLGGVLALAAVIVVVVIVASSGGGSDKSKTTSTAGGAKGSAAAQLLGGIPQKGLTLGKPDAPVTLVEFNDMQCPFCDQYQRAVFPTLVRDYVRKGKLRMEMRLQSFIGPDSVTGAKAVAAAAAQNKGWTYADAFYDNQGQENSGYVNQDFLRSIGKGIPGLNVDKLLSDMNTPAAAAALKSGEAAFNTAHLSSTPSFLIGKTGGPMSVLHWNDLKVEQFTGPIDSLLGT